MTQRNRYQPRRVDPATVADHVDDLVPWRRAALLLEVKDATLARWIDRGRLPYALIEGRRYVSVLDASDVEAETRRAGKRA